MKTDTTSNVERLKKIATMLSVSLIICMLLAKALAAWTTGSASIVASLIDSISDGAVALVGFFAIRYALAPADDEHPHGHHGIEDITSPIQATLILLAVAGLVIYAFNSIINPQPLQESAFGLIVMLFSMTLTILLIAYLSYVLKQTTSPTIKNELSHYKGDVIANFGVILVLLLTSLPSWGLTLSGALDVWTSISTVTLYVFVPAIIIHLIALYFPKTRHLERLATSKIWGYIEIIAAAILLVHIILYALHAHGEFLVWTSKVIPYLDPVFALFAACLMAHGAWETLASAFHNILEGNQKEITEKVAAALRREITVLDTVYSFDQLSTRFKGSKLVISFHLRMKSNDTDDFFTARTRLETLIADEVSSDADTIMVYISLADNPRKTEEKPKQELSVVHSAKKA